MALQSAPTRATEPLHKMRANGDPIKDTDAEFRLFVQRAIVAVGLAVVGLTVLIGRLVHLQVVDHDRYHDLADGNRARPEVIAPWRGVISDAGGTLLADNVPSWQLVVTPENVRGMDATLDRLSEVIDLDEQEIARFRRALRSHRSFDTVPLKYRLTDEEVARFSVKRQQFPGVDVTARLTRRYPYGELTAHVVGYVSSLSEDDLRRLDPQAYRGTTHTGRTGVERAYEHVLHGSPGHRRVKVNAQGRRLQVLRPGKSTPGRDIKLTLDLRVQRAAAQALNGQRGAAVAVSPRDGSILALYSSPSFDPNRFGNGLSHAEYARLLNSAAKPLFNRALQGAYPPGSTIKPILGLAGLQLGLATPESSTYCPGHFSLPGNSHRYRDWKPTGHGHVDLHHAVEQSCDVYFYELATRLGIDTMHNWLVQFGLGVKVDLGIGSEHAGLVPSRDWKRRAFRRREDQTWFPGETVIAGIGQGYMLSTPLQLARATAALAARGEHYEPRLVEAIRDAESDALVRTPARALAPIEADDAAWDQVHAAMHAVVNGSRGTARAIAVDSPYQIAGKSGTAQVFTVAQDEEYDAEELDVRLRDHAWFVAFAPVDAPEIAVAVIVENGGSGSRVAAPVARALMDAYLDQPLLGNGTLAGQ
jgi:penicillin-binding protein 2